MRYQVLKEGRFGHHKYSVRDMDDGRTVVIYDTRKAAEGHAASLNRPDRMSPEDVKRHYDAFTNCNALADRR